MAKMAHGICDNLLMAVWQSARCPVMAAPAMDVDMWHHPVNQGNLGILESCGVRIVRPATGELASGLTGEGRMEEPEMLFTSVEKFFSDGRPMSGKRVLVTAGPTHENIDAVRYIGNRSTGKMGFALADAFARQGADVTLVTGPVSLQTQERSVERIDVESADEMRSHCIPACDTMDIVVMCAAVADYTPARPVEGKMKKQDAEMELALKPTSDILAEMGARKKSGQFLTGFALETDHEKNNALAKLQRKNLDLVVLNSLNDAGAGFGHDTNQVTLLDRDSETAFGLLSKDETARRIVDYIAGKIK
jgi:phosphopantothenoylcysteine decarboxylase/phosphopantothenate--cysteine ligase